MRKIAIVLASFVSLAGCESNLLLPMEPTRESAAAPRRALTEAERDTIVDAVSLALKDQKPQEFTWAPLVGRAHDSTLNYCGIVKLPNGFAGKLVYGKYYAKLKFDRGDKLSKVELISYAEIAGDNIPTSVDSICVQDGYGVLVAPK